MKHLWGKGDRAKRRRFERRAPKLDGVSMRMTYLNGAMAAGAMALALALPASEAQAQSFGQSVFARLFGFGDDEAAINYSELAPLVIPPSRTLEQPKSAAAVAEDPAWPKDPDEKKRRKKASADSRGPASNNTELVPQQQLAAGRLTGGGVDQRSALKFEEDYKRMSNPVNPKVLSRKGSFGPKEDPLVPGVEPPRQTLVDPPQGYRAPSARASLDANEPLPSEVASGENLPWYQKIWKFGGGKN
jgi:hypothetical protein